MIIAEVTIRVQERQPLDPVLDAVRLWLGALRNNGQIYGREFPISSLDQALRIYLMLPERGSPDRQYANHYVLSALDQLTSAGGSPPQVIEQGEDPEGSPVCSCPASSAYLLYTTYLRIESPIRCGDCFGPVPLYRIPATSNGEYNDIISWQTNYQACDSLQMNCRVLERSATRELSHLDSALSRDGRDICARIAGSTGVPTYYYLYRYAARSRRQELGRVCPSCGGTWLIEPAWHDLFDFKCDRCHLLSNIAWGV